MIYYNIVIIIYNLIFQTKGWRVFLISIRSQTVFRRTHLRRITQSSAFGLKDRIQLTISIATGQPLGHINHVSLLSQ